MNQQANLDVLSRQVLDTAQAMIANDLNRGSAGNVSARFEGGFIITPTGMDYKACAPSDMVFVDMNGNANINTAAVTRKPSSEWLFHRDIYLHHANAQAVVHAHSPFATSLACMEVEIPSFHYMIARFGGSNVRCASYATFGTQELSDSIVRALNGRCACLIAHHGMVVHGRNLDHALALAVEIETLSEQFWRVLQLGQPKLLSEEEMQRVLEKFDGYGQQ
jgi:L-fuculose-phosphate aldolase